MSAEHEETTAHRPVASRQLTMFGAEPRLLEPHDDGAGVLGESPEDASATPDAGEGQIDLFAPLVVLGREMDAAIAAGRFELAARLRSTLDESYGPSALTEGRAFLDRLGAVSWEDAPGVALSAWVEVDGHLADRPYLRARVREGVFARLLASHAPEALVETRPESLPFVAAAVDSGGDGLPRAGRHRARELVRDALLAGRALSPPEFAYDEAVADLLAEDFSPPWLACLGLIRRLWSAPPPDAGHGESFSSIAADVPSPEGAARDFWRYLGIAESEDCPDERLHDARRRMKQLQPGLHTLYMRRPHTRRR